MYCLFKHWLLNIDFLSTIKWLKQRKLEESVRFYIFVNSTFYHPLKRDRILPAKI